MSSIQDSRPRFFEGQYLGADDLTAAVRYGHVQEARHSLGAHTWGIGIGLRLKDVTEAGGQLQTYVQPGFAWDGFGRLIVVSAPFAVPAELFKNLVYDPVIDEPGGRLVKVWLRYRETKSRKPATGFEICSEEDQNSRIQETFSVEIGDRLVSEQHDNLNLNESSVPAEQAFSFFDVTDPLIPDGSIPHQTFPENGTRSKWLICLGYVRWKPNPLLGQPGTFQPTSNLDTAASLAERIPIGVVAGAIQAAEKILRLKDRTAIPSAVRSDDLVWVEGSLRVEGDAKLFRGKLDLRDRLGTTQGVPLSLQRTGDGTNERQLRAEIGNAQNGQNSFQVGPTVAKNFTPVVTVLDNGRMGLGTAAPSARLEIKDGDLVLKAAAEDAGDIIFQSSAGVEKGRVWSNPSVGPSLFLASAGTTPHLAIDVAGRVGVGTATPDKAVTVFGSAGAYLNIKGHGGTEQVLIGADAGGGIVSTVTNHDLQLRAGSDSTKVTIKASGRVGIGTTAPSRQVHVVGDRIRLQNSGKTLDLRADGSAVDLQSETNDLYLRASGPGGNNNIIMNHGAQDGNVAIGHETPLCKLHVQGSKNAGANDPAAHVALIENTSGGSDADVLALKIGRSQASSNNNFVTFFHGANASGRIEGDGSGGVTYATSGADFAECLPKLDAHEFIEPGDVVGIVAGRITRSTGRAQHVSAITAKPAVLGNAPAPEDQACFGRVAMLGQVRVKVRGPVSAGDVIVASGLNDGTARALSEEDAVRSDAAVVGMAWESSSQQDVKLINTSIGHASNLFRLQQREIQRLRRQLADGEP